MAGFTLSADAGAQKSLADVAAASAAAGANGVVVTVDPTKITSKGQLYDLLTVIRDSLSQFNWPPA